MWNKIETIIEKAEVNFSEGGVTEEKTKQFLIEPILNVLGWNLTNPNEVQREYKKVVDYALFGGRITLFLEAKKLGTHLDSAMQQVLQYAIQRDVKPDFVITTDGVRWNCVSIRYRSLLFSVDLRNPTEKGKQQFMLLGKQAVDEGALMNYANNVRTEEEVLAYLNQHASQIASEIHAYDSIFNEQAIVNYINHLANQTLIVIRIEEPRPADTFPSVIEKLKEASDSWQRNQTDSMPAIHPGSSLQWSSTYDIRSLDRQYLRLVAQRVTEMEKQIGEPLFVRFGITGNWDTPNYQVETATGRQTWTFHGRGRRQKPFKGVGRFNPNKITAKKYSLEDLLKVLE
ncbi:MAG TPA: hypothetical protein EYP64_02715 [Desulfarculaceae bacterium]|nr:hypothetical protein [Desulfarculaceae bacterium]